MADYKDKLDEWREAARRKARELDEKYGIKERVEESARVAGDAARRGAEKVAEGAERARTEAERLGDDFEVREAARRAAEEEGEASAFRTAAQYQWAGSGDGSRSRDEMRALDALELEVDAEFTAIKAAYRRLAKQFHPDVNQGDKAAAMRFQQVQASYDVLRRAEERKAGVKL